MLVKIKEFDGALRESPPRMTIYGTCAPPRPPYSKFICSLGLPATSPLQAISSYHSLPTSQARGFPARMSTGGRAPPLVFLSSQKGSSPAIMRKPVPNASPFMERAITAAGTSDQSSCEASARGNSTAAELTGKRPWGRPKKTIRPRSNPHNRPLNQVVNKPQYGNKPRGRPKKGPAVRSENSTVKPGEMSLKSSASKLEDPMKRPQGRLKKMSASRSEKPMVKPGEMPLKSSANTQVTASFMSKCSKEPFVLLSRWIQKKEDSGSVGQVGGILANVKQRRPVGRPRKRGPVGRCYPKKSVRDTASQNQDEVELQMTSVCMSLNDGSSSRQKEC